MVKPLIEHVVTQLVDAADHVVVTERQDGEKMTVHVQVAQDDIKRVIGKDGRIIRAIRMLAQVVYANGHLEVVVDSAQV